MDKSAVVEVGQVWPKGIALYNSAFFRLPGRIDLGLVPGTDDLEGRTGQDTGQASQATWAFPKQMMNFVKVLSSS